MRKSGISIGTGTRFASFISEKALEARIIRGSIQDTDFLFSGYRYNLLDALLQRVKESQGRSNFENNKALLIKYCEKRFLYLLLDEKHQFRDFTQLSDGEFHSLVQEIEKYPHDIENTGLKTWVDLFAKHICLDVRSVPWNPRSPKFLKILGNKELYQEYNLHWFRQLLPGPSSRKLGLGNVTDFGQWLQMNVYEVNDRTFLDYYGVDAVPVVRELIKTYLQKTLQAVKKLEKPDDRFDFIQSHLRHISFLKGDSQLLKLNEQVAHELQEIQEASGFYKSEELLDHLIIQLNQIIENFKAKNTSYQEGLRNTQIILSKILILNASFFSSAQKNVLHNSLKQFLDEVGFHFYGKQDSRNSFLYKEDKPKIFIEKQIPLIEQLIASHSLDHSGSVRTSSDLFAEDFILFAARNYIQGLCEGYSEYARPAIIQLEQFIKRIFLSDYSDDLLNQIIDVIEQSECRGLLEVLPLRGLELGAKKKIASCNLRLGISYLYRYPLTQNDLRQAWQCFQDGKEDPRSSLHMAEFYSAAEGSLFFGVVDCDITRAIEYCEDAGNAGYDEAFYKMGELYEKQGQFAQALAAFKRVNVTGGSSSFGKVTKKLADKELWYKAARDYARKAQESEQAVSESFEYALFCYLRVINFCTARKTELEEKHQSILNQSLSISLDKTSIDALKNALDSAKTPEEVDKKLEEYANNEKQNSDLICDYQYVKTLYQAAVRYAIEKNLKEGSHYHCEIAQLYEEQVSHEKNPQEIVQCHRSAMNHYRMAADLGDEQAKIEYPRCHYVIAQLYEKQIPHEKNSRDRIQCHRGAMNHYRMAAYLGDEQAKTEYRRLNSWSHWFKEILQDGWKLLQWSRHPLQSTLFKDGDSLSRLTKLSDSTGNSDQAEQKHTEELTQKKIPLVTKATVSPGKFQSIVEREKILIQSKYPKLTVQEFTTAIKKSDRYLLLIKNKTLPSGLKHFLVHRILSAFLTNTFIPSFPSFQEFLQGLPNTQNSYLGFYSRYCACVEKLGDDLFEFFDCKKEVFDHYMKSSIIGNFSPTLFKPNTQDCADSASDGNPSEYTNNLPMEVK